LYHYIEELLFMYGFVEKNNPHDALVLQAPWTHANDFRAAAAASKKNKNKKWWSLPWWGCTTCICVAPQHTVESS
jgi:hypothetical protein